MNGAAGREDIDAVWRIESAGVAAKALEADPSQTSRGISSTALSPSGTGPLAAA